MKPKAITTQRTLTIALIVGMLMLSTFTFSATASENALSLSSNSLPYSILALDVPGITEDTQALDSAGIPYTAVTPAQFATVTLSKYDVLFVSWLPSGADPSAFNALIARKTEMATLISQGWGVVANSEWSGSTGVPGTPYGWLPVTITTGGLDTGDAVHVTKTTHPIITGGGPLGGGALNDTLLSSWAASFHNLLTGYTTCQDIAVKSGTTNAVILAITYGSGRIVVTGMDPEWHTIYGSPADKTGPKTMLKNTIDWASGYLEHLFPFTFTGEGQYKYYYSNLGSLADRDKFVMTTTVKLTITVIVADCCIMGDTIGIFYPTSTTLLMSKTSPGIIVGTATFAAGTYTWWVGYVACPGGFPAGYWTWIIATHG